MIAVLLVSSGSNKKSIRVNSIRGTTIRIYFTVGSSHTKYHPEILPHDTQPRTYTLQDGTVSGWTNSRNSKPVEALSNQLIIHRSCRNMDVRASFGFVPHTSNGGCESR